MNSTQVSSHDEDVLLGPVEGGKLLGRKKEWMLAHSTGGQKPTIPFVQFGRFVQFRRSDLRKFVEKHSEG